jgi:hypothetical protein
MIKRTTLSNRKKTKKTTKWHRHKTTSTRIALQAAVRQMSLFSANFQAQKRKKSRRSLRFNEASFLNRFLIQSRRLIFDEIRDDRRKHRSKKRNDRFSTKTKTLNRRLNVVVVQNFNEFFLFYLYDKIK